MTSAGKLMRETLSVFRRCWCARSNVVRIELRNNLAAVSQGLWITAHDASASCRQKTARRCCVKRLRMSDKMKWNQTEYNKLRFLSVNSLPPESTARYCVRVRVRFTVMVGVSVIPFTRRSKHQANMGQLQHTSCACILNTFAWCLLDVCLIV